MDVAPPPSAPEEPPARDWSKLPLDALSLVFVRLGAFDILMGAGLVCRSWLDAAKLPDVWRVVDMEYRRWTANYSKELADLCAMAKAAVDRSNGQLRVFAGKNFVTERLLQYIVERSPSLTVLRLVSCWYVFFSQELTNVTREYPLLELRSLELDNIDLTLGELTNILENCPVLEVLRVRNCCGINIDDEPSLRAKFARIKTIKVEFADALLYNSDFELDDYDFDHVPDFEDERTDDGSL